DCSSCDSWASWATKALESCGDSGSWCWSCAMKRRMNWSLSVGCAAACGAAALVLAETGSIVDIWSSSGDDPHVGSVWSFGLRLGGRRAGGARLARGRLLLGRAPVGERVGGQAGELEAVAPERGAELGGALAQVEHGLLAGGARMDADRLLGGHDRDE